MKICDLTQFYAPRSGGVKRYLHEKISYIQSESIGDEHVLIVPGPKTDVVARERSRIYTIRSPAVPRSGGYRALLGLSTVAEIIERERPDIIESADPYQLGWKAASIGKALKIPVIGFYHSHFVEAYLKGLARVLVPTAKRYVTGLYNRFETTLAPSQHLTEILKDWGVRDVRTVTLGVNTAILSPDPNDRTETRQSLGIASDRKLLLYVGRLAPEKNVETLFGAFRILARRRPDEFELLVIGSGPEDKKLHQLEREIKNVKSIPYCSEPAELGRFYRAADLFVHPGIQETFGLVALESQASATPVVGILGSRMDQIIFHDQNSWASQNTPAGLAGAIEEFCRQDLRALGKSAAETVRRDYSWSEVFNRVFCIYRQVCANYRKSLG